MGESQKFLCMHRVRLCVYSLFILQPLFCTRTSVIKFREMLFIRRNNIAKSSRNHCGPWIDQMSKSATIYSKANHSESVPICFQRFHIRLVIGWLHMKKERSDSNAILIRSWKSRDTYHYRMSKYMSISKLKGPTTHRIRTLW